MINPLIMIYSEQSEPSRNTNANTRLILSQLKLKQLEKKLSTEANFPNELSSSFTTLDKWTKYQRQLSREQQDLHDQHASLLKSKFVC